MNLPALFGLALWLAAIGHACLLGAAVQVPARLGWRQDLASLRPMNRKLLWTYGGFTVLTIVAFGLLTAVLHDELLAGDRAALGLAAFIGVYWLARLGVDAWYGHAGWPPGRAMVAGHVLLSGLFAALSATYLGLVAWQLL
jgi:hypothetical protein